ncbi:MAG: hypothetical protein LBM92_07840 [Opitutaceae bacterium]|jgi:hypothetical protein|nr:hypothetical protein [Opitutaceae bacterium]
MTLTPAEAELFFKLYYALNWWTNKTHHVIPSFTKPVYGTGLPISFNDFQKVRNALWENPQWVDDFLAGNDSAGFTKGERDIVADWRRYFVTGDFIVHKHLSRYSVLMTMQGKPTRLYGVCGLHQHIKEVLTAPTPFMAQSVVLLPFNGRIIYDGIASFPGVFFGPGIRSDLKEEYAGTKEKSGIITTLDGESHLKKQPGSGKSPASPRRTGNRSFSKNTRGGQKGEEDGLDY